MQKKPQRSFCSCCEEFLICTQTYSWRYLTLTLIDSTAFFLVSWYATLHMKVFCKQNKSHGFWFYYEIFWVFDSNRAGSGAHWNLWPNSFQVFKSYSKFQIWLSPMLPFCTRHHNPHLIRNPFWLLTPHKDWILVKKALKSSSSRSYVKNTALIHSLQEKSIGPTSKILSNHKRA